MVIISHVSIHAPRVGRDVRSLASSHRPRFQFTRPAWGATRKLNYLFTALAVSIHAPRVGRDAATLKNYSQAMVSIHAPRVGRDDKTYSFIKKPHRFNSRAPRGARLNHGKMRRSCARFNSRAPRGARQYPSSKVCPEGSFQFTRPAWGATAAYGAVHRFGTGFNSRAPRGARHPYPPLLKKWTSFNSRAPRGARHMRKTAR